MNKALEDILLCNFTLEELLELNDITEEDVIRLLYEQGLIGEPEQLIRQFEIGDEE